MSIAENDDLGKRRVTLVDFERTATYEFEGKLYYNSTEAINAKIRELVDSGITPEECDERKLALESKSAEPVDEVNGADEDEEFMPDNPPASYVLSYAYIYAARKLRERRYEQEREAKRKEEIAEFGYRAANVRRPGEVMRHAKELVGDGAEWDELVANNEHSTPVASVAAESSAPDSVSETAEAPAAPDDPRRDMSAEGYDPKEDPDLRDNDGDFTYSLLEKKAHKWFRVDGKPLHVARFKGDRKATKIIKKILDENFVPASDAGAGAAGAAQEASGSTEWAEGWYYLAARDRVVRPGSLTTYSKQGFDALFAREQKVEGGKAFDFVRKRVGFAHADGMAYLAGAAPVFEFQGQTLVNEFIPSSVPQPAASYTDEGLAAVETIRYHLTLLTGEYKLPRREQKYAHMLESWIALNIRAPGKIIGIAPLIKGIQGDGKTVIFNKMMAALLGEQNVKEASTKEVCSDFNPYAYGAAVRVIEELRMAGENRFAVADGIKPNITNAVVRVVAKRANGIDLPNATNYVALTNHADAVPIDDTDRRWFIVFTPWAHIDELAAVVGDLKAYFTRLHSTIETNAAALVKYFKEDCAIHADFFHGMRAPSTPWRGEVIDQEQALIGGDFFASYVENGEHGVSREIVVTDLLTQAFERDMPRATAPKTRQVARLLKAKKWHRVPGVVKLSGKTRIVYVADPRILEMGDELRNAKLRELFAATVPADYEKNRTAYEGAGGF